MRFQMTSYIDPVDKLQHFSEVAVTCRFQKRFVLHDASHPSCRKTAEKWLREELTFLNKRDMADLKSIYYQAVEDGREYKSFFNAIEVLKEKYSMVK